MRNFFAERMNNLLPSGIRKVNEKALEMERNGEKVIHFEIGRPDFDTPDYIKKEGINSIKRGEVFYTSNFGDMELRKEIAKSLSKRQKTEYEPEEILATVGLSEAIFDLLGAILDEGDEILVPDPVWINYVNVPKFFRACPVTYNLVEENNYQLDLNEIKEKITEKTKAIVIISPNNPTGGVLSRDTLEGIADIAKKNDLLVISDEVYNRIVFDDSQCESIVTIPGMKERTLLLNGFSKAYSMTGWRLGYVAANKEFIMQFNKIHQHNVICAPSFVQKAAIVALRDETNEVDEMVWEYKRRRDYAVNAINSIDGISCKTPGGAFYIFINIKELEIKSEEAADYLLDKEKIALVPGSVFGTNGEGYLRMSFANSYENIVEGCNRLKKGIESLRHR